jgi:hypothetical protein
MMELLPEGKSIGWMQAPPQWIFAHTQRFVGIVRIVIHDGEGFILINKGKVLGYYFRQGRIELTGKAALDYISSNPAVEFNLCRLTPEEMETALKSLNIKPEGEVSQPEISDTTADDEFTTIESLTSPVEEEYPSEQGSEPEAGDVPYDHDESLFEPRQPFEANLSPVILDREYLEDPDIRIISQIKKLNGVVAISVFDEERNILLMGNVEIEPLLKIARNLLETTKKITPLVDWGHFVHMTLQVPEGNIIVAPFRDYFLCLLTTRTINIGHIRRILRDIQMTEDGPEYE